MSGPVDICIERVEEEHIGFSTKKPDDEVRKQIVEATMTDEQKQDEIQIEKNSIESRKLIECKKERKHSAAGGRISERVFAEDEISHTKSGRWGTKRKGDVNVIPPSYKKARQGVVNTNNKRTEKVRKEMIRGSVTKHKKRVDIAGEEASPSTLYFNNDTPNGHQTVYKHMAQENDIQISAKKMQDHIKNPFVNVSFSQSQEQIQKERRKTKVQFTRREDITSPKEFDVQAFLRKEEVVHTIAKRLRIRTKASENVIPSNEKTGASKRAASSSSTPVRRKIPRVKKIQHIDSSTSKQCAISTSRNSDDKVRMQLRRATMTEKQKQVQKEKDRGRKRAAQAPLMTVRRGMSKRGKNEQKDKDKIKTKVQFTEGEDSISLKEFDNRTFLRNKEIVHPIEEKSDLRRKEKENVIPSDEKTGARKRAASASSMPVRREISKVKNIQQTNKDNCASKQCAFNTSRNSTDKVRKQLIRATMTEKQKQIQREKDRERKRAARASLMTVRRGMLKGDKNEQKDKDKIKTKVQFTEGEDSISLKEFDNRTFLRNKEIVHPIEEKSDLRRKEKENVIPSDEKTGARKRAASASSMPVRREISKVKNIQQTNKDNCASKQCAFNTSRNSTDKVRKQLMRATMTEKQKQIQREKDRERKRAARASLMTVRRGMLKGDKNEQDMEDLRSSKSEQEKEQQKCKDKQRKADLRQSKSEQEKEQRKCKERQRKADLRSRKPEQEKEQQKCKERQRLADLRSRKPEQEKEQQKCKERQRLADLRSRKPEQEKEQQKYKERQRKADLRSRKPEQEKEQQKCKERQRLADLRSRKPKQEKEQRKCKERQRKADLRSRKPEQEKEQQKCKERQRKADLRSRKPEQEKEQQKCKERQRQADLRSRKPEQEKEQQKCKERQRQADLRSRKKGELDTFKRLIKVGPEFTCTCCHRMMYRESVLLVNDCRYPKLDMQIKSQCITATTSNDGNEYMCKTCDWSLKRSKMPAQCSKNSLMLTDVPDDLKNLSGLEVSFICKRLAFMKILALPRGKQKAIHGSVINVPCNPDETCGILPRLPSSSSVITVKLKRKLKYNGHVFYQKIRPWKVLRALHYLKNIQKNIHYHDVSINDNWGNDCAEENNELWESLNGLDTQSDEHHDFAPVNDEADDAIFDESDSDIDTDEFEELMDVRTNNYGLPLDSCIQPKDISSDPDCMLTIAPGEGKRPLGMISDMHNEVLAFPNLFPDGQNGFSTPRATKLSMKQYFNSRILNRDNRFASNIEYLFYAQFRTEAKEVYDSLTIALRKSKDKHNTDITAADIKDALKARSLTRNDLNYNFLQKVRGSPAYYNKMMYDLLGMIRMLGPCTWFLTLSAADMKWQDTIQVIAAQHGEILTDEDVIELSWEQKGKWLRSNPVTAARHFDHRFQLFMKHIIMGKSLPIGGVKDFKYRIEFQLRGSPHVHMVAWVENAPVIGRNSIDEVTTYIDKFVSCRSVDDDDLVLQQLTQTVQKHTHSFTCRKTGKLCRFSFPRPPVKNTTIFIPAEVDTSTVSKSKEKKYRNLLQTLLQTINSGQNEELPDIDTMLHNLGFSYNEYMEALTWNQTKKACVTILYQRNPSDCFINNYSKDILSAWSANMDLQYITNVYACIMYVASYISKPEKTLGEVLQSVSKESEPRGPKERMQAVAKKFLSSREVSAQEAAYRLLSLPLTKASRTVVYIPTDMPEERTKLIKPYKQIQQLDDEDPDIYQSGLLDKYKSRPRELENLCLADFASCYTYSRIRMDISTDPDMLGDFSDNDEPHQPTQQKLQLPSSIRLQDSNIKLSLRKKTAIIRTHQYSLKRDQEKFYHSKLLLYFPWRNEENDLTLDGSYKTKYLAVQESLKDKYEEYEPNFQEYVAAITAFDEQVPTEDAWSELTPQTEQERLEDRATENQLSEEHLYLVPSADDISGTPRMVPHQFEVDNQLIPNKQWLQMTTSLNDEQQAIHQYITNFCIKLSMTYKTQVRPKPFAICLLGGAGVGKSHVVRTIVQTAIRTLQFGQSADENVVLVCAFTGAAAFNISGHTLHSSFKLPVDNKETSDYIPLSNMQLANIREKLGNLQLLIIDEISLVGSKLLQLVHHRLCDIKGSEEPFGGVSVLVVGDLYQLPPVGQSQIFVPPSENSLGFLYGSLWKKNFRLLELTTIMRQKDDLRFAQALNNIRLDDASDDDISLIKTREITEESDDYPRLSLHIMTTNKRKDKHNGKIINSLGQKIVEVNAQDSKRDRETGQIIQINLSDEAGGLLKTLQLCIGARVSLTSNICVDDGLVNSACGTVTNFIPEIPQNLDGYRPKYVLVLFDDKVVGYKRRMRFKNIMPDDLSTPIEVYEAPVRMKKLTATRVQFPLALSWAITIHKAQGRTVDQLVINTEGTFYAGQMYTALSRVKTLNGLFILNGFSRDQIRCNKKAKDEMQRMRNTMPFRFPIPDALGVPKEFYFKLTLLNISSLECHFECLQKNHKIISTDFVCLTETWLKKHDISSNYELSDFLLFRADRESENLMARGGVAIQLSEIYHPCKEIRIPATFENIAIIAEYRDIVPFRVMVVTIYNKPSNKFKHFMRDLDTLLCGLPTESFPTIICGDFNVNIFANNSHATDLKKLTKHHGFLPYVNTPTHRAGGTLDHIYINRDYLQTSLISVIPLHFTDHFAVVLSVPYDAFSDF